MRLWSFPKRNLDKFKIPKKKNTSSAQPAKNSVSIPALDVQEKTKQVNLTTATLIPQTKATSSVNDSDYAIKYLLENKLQKLNKIYWLYLLWVDCKVDEISLAWIY